MSFATRAAGLYSAEDADSEGEEGRYYVWSLEEMTEVLGPALAAEAADWYGVAPEGNFEGRTVLHRARRGDLLRPPAIEAARIQAPRGPSGPGTAGPRRQDHHRMERHDVLDARRGGGRHRQAATGPTPPSRSRPSCSVTCAATDGRVLRSWCRGQANLLGYAADYAWLVDCCTRLGELSGEPRWTAEAVTIARQLLELFADRQAGRAVHDRRRREPRLWCVPVSVYDGVTPAAGSVAAVALARLGALAGDDEFAEAAARIVGALGATLSAAPSAFPELLLAATLLEHGPVEIVVTGERPDLLHAARQRFLPGAVLAWRPVARTAPIPSAQAPGLRKSALRGPRGRSCLRLPTRSLPRPGRQRRRPARRPRRTRCARHEVTRPQGSRPRRRRRPGAVRADRPGTVLRCLLLAGGPEWVAVDVASGALVRSRASGWPTSGARESLEASEAPA